MKPRCDPRRHVPCDRQINTNWEDDSSSPLNFCLDFCIVSDWVSLPESEQMMYLQEHSTCKLAVGQRGRAVWMIRVNESRDVRDCHVHVRIKPC
jgi:hypothetical protein